MDDEPTGGLDTEISVEVGSSVSGEIETEGDIDYIAVELEAGVTYQFDLEGQYTASGTLGDPFLTGIFNSSNINLTGSDDDGGIATHSRITFTPNFSGTYYVAVSHFDNTGQEDIGTYTLYVDTAEASDRPDPISFSTISNTGNEVIDGITASQGYGADEDGITRVTYSYPAANATFVQEFNLDEDGPDLTMSNVPASTETIAFFESGLQQVSTFANIEFSVVVEAGISFGTLRLSGNNAESGNVLGIAGLPNRFPSGGDIYIFEDNIVGNSRLGFVTLHELGHALGLTHAEQGEYPNEYRGAEFTLMAPSFTSSFFPTASSADLYPNTFSYGDILALRHIYGENENANAGNNTYQFDLAERYWQTIFDLGGTDTIEIIGSGKSVRIDLTPDGDALGGSFINVGTTINYFAAGVNVGSRSETVFVSPETVIENVIAANGHDVVTGNTANNRIEGNDGNDSLNGAAGADRLFGGNGNDKLTGGTGADFLRADDGDDAASGGDGNDELFAGGSDTGDDIFVGDAGNDTLGGGAGNDFLIGGGQSGTIDGLEDTGSSETDDGADTLFGGNGNDTLVGGGFNDDDDDGAYDDGEAVMTGTEANTLYAGLGDDVVVGAAGADTIGGGTGDDTLEGGDGNDTFYGGRNDTESTTLNDVINAGAGDDYVAASGGADSIDGGDGNDTIFGGAGNDTILGGGGADEIYNSAGNDSVDGGDGDDTLRGNGGDDTITGSGGADTFIFRSGDGDDHVTDFTTGEDVLRLSDTNTDFTDLASVEAAASNTTVDGVEGVLIDTGGGDSLFLAGLSVDTLQNVDFIFA